MTNMTFIRDPSQLPRLIICTVLRTDVAKGLAGTLTFKGGKGSGHRGHAGRPGLQGGSLPGAGALPPTPAPSGLGSALSYRPSNDAKMEARDATRADIEMYAEELGITESELTRRITKRLDKDLAKPIAIRTSLDSAEAILVSGRFKTQFETGTSGGSFDLDDRYEAELKGLGVPITTKDRPVYGYFRTRHHDAADYGHIEFVLKDHVKARSTYTIGDSLGPFQFDVQVGATSSGHIEGWNEEGGHYNKGGVSAIGYIEAQIQGGVKLADIGKIIIHSSQKQVDRNHGDLLTLAKEKGITVEVDASTP